MTSLSILDGMPAWIRHGIAPSAADMHAAGLTDDWRRGLDLSDDAYMRRRAFIRSYGFSLPCAEAIEALKGLSPLLEIGAGTGYWSAILSAAGADIIATDKGPSPYAFEPGAHFPVQRIRATPAVRKHLDRNVFVSWPCYASDWATRAAGALAPGRAFAFYGEGEGGCTGNDRLFAVLERDFDAELHVETPQFPGLHDRLTIYRKRAA